MHTQVGALTLPVDHLAFATDDIEAAARRFDELRLPHTRVASIRWTDPGGHLEARSVSAVLTDGYVDVIELPETAGDTMVPTGVIVSTGDLDATRRELMGLGVRCAQPYRIVRRFDDGEPAHTYDVFGTDLHHPCGLALAVIHNHQRPMTNGPGSTVPPPGLSDAAARLGVELELAP